jgi:MFS family permease
MVLKEACVSTVRWQILGILFLAIFASMLGAGLVAPLLPVYAHGLGATGLYIGFIFAAFSLSRTICLPLFGRLSDVKGRKPFITLGLLAYFMASIAYIISANVSSLILIRVFQGTAAAMILPVARAYAGEITPKGKEGTVMGVFNVSLYGGLSVGPVIGGVFKDVFGIKAAFLSMGIVSLLGFLACLVFLPSRKEEKVRLGAHAPLRYRSLFSDRHIMGLFLFSLTHTMCVGTIWSFAPLLADVELGLSSVEAGFIITFSVLMSALLMAPMGFVADRVNRRFLVVIGGLITASAMIFFYTGQEYWPLFVASIFVGVGGGIALPAIMAMGVVIGRAKDSMGSIMAILTMGHSLAMVLGPVLAGIIVDTLNIRLAFLGGAITMFLGTAGALSLTSRLYALGKRG